MSDDLPTFERPTNATSHGDSGNWPTDVAERTNFSCSGLGTRGVYGQRSNTDTLWGMCRRVQCSKCSKPSWAGCGAHVESVLGDVPKNQRCQCKSGGGMPRAKKSGGGLFSRLLKK